MRITSRTANFKYVISISFERIPSDYAVLKMTQPNEDAGGDTLWASAYEAYDRLSPTFQKFAEGLTATHYQPDFLQVKEKFGEDLIEDYRGSPENTGLDFKAEQYVSRSGRDPAQITFHLANILLCRSSPVIRTNPVTGWKSLFGACHQVKFGWYNDVTPRESDILKQYCKLKP